MKILIENKIPFNLYVNTGSSKIEGGMGTPCCTGDKIDLKYLSFIGKVKNSVKQRIKSGELKAGRPLKEKIDYFAISPIYKTSFKSFDNCYEVDIDSAYWQTAFMKNVITKEIYKQGNDLTKKSKDLKLSQEERDMLKAVRLISLGILAKKTTHYYFDGNKMNPMPDIEDKKTQYFWNLICGHVAKVMQDIAFKIQDDYLFYWVDAVFIKGEKLDQVKSIIKEAGYEFKVKKISKITFKKGEIVADKKSFAISSKTVVDSNLI